MDKQEILRELQFRAIRSGGPGGQHANKVSSKVELNFNLKDSKSLTESEKERLAQFFKNRLSQAGILVLQCDETRSQHQNRSLLIRRFLKLLDTGLKKPKPRKPTRPKRSAVLKRLASKKKLAQKKQQRQKPKPE
ncbi:MAG: aminoacyl-tRNA hydrolase [Eudoraea sp.]|nr:aminoacyl-tRNA hydrolase [Eudoraea sp.]MBT8208916.1 aminoacyl-tRNA hydrolase [Eudoraea sp.]NNK30337.1 aminoacyl-tRNA hydrolase [Flavobacteriaceae bacterium]